MFLMRMRIIVPQMAHIITRVDNMTMPHWSYEHTHAHTHIVYRNIHIYLRVHARQTLPNEFMNNHSIFI